MDFNDSFKDSFKNLLGESNSAFHSLKNGAKKLGPYHSYDMKLFEILPSNKIDNKNNRIILDSFSNLVCDGIWKPVLQGRYPLGLEVFADGETTTFHILLPKDNIEFMIGKIYACYNGSTINKVDFKNDYINQFVNDNISDVYKLDIRNHPFMPFSMDLIPIGNTITEAMEYIQPGERACVQILLQPIDSDWQHKFRYAYNQYLLTNRMPPFGTNAIRYIICYIDRLIEFIGSIFSRNDNMSDTSYRAPKITDRDLNKEVTDKLSASGYRASIKITVQSSDKYKRSTVSRSIASSFTQMNKYNEFSFKKLKNSDKALEEFRHRKMCRGDDFLITSAEAKNLLNMPDEKVRTNKLKRAEPREELVDSRVMKGKIQIGETLPYKNKVYPVNLPTDSPLEYNKTVMVAAPPGFGKTTILENIAYQCMELGWGFFAPDVADGKMAIRCLNILEHKHDKKIAYLDFTNMDRLPLLSPSCIVGTPTTRALLFADWFSQILQIGKDAIRTKAYLEKYCLTCFADPDNTLLEFKLLLEGDENVRRNMIDKLKLSNPEVYMWWTITYPKEEKEIQHELRPLRYRLDMLLNKDIFMNVFCNNKSKIDVSKWMDEGYAVIVNISEGGNITTSIQQSILSFMILLFWSATLERKKLTTSGVEPRHFRLLLDEPYTYLHVTDTIEEALTKFRKYGVAINVFFHDAQQFIKRSADLWNALLSTDPHLILGYLTEKTINLLLDRFPNMKKEEVYELFNLVSDIDKHYFVANIYNNGKLKPFIFHSSLAIEKEYNKDEVIKRSNELYAPLTAEELKAEYFLRRFHMTIQEYEQFIKGKKGGEVKWENKEEEEVKEIPSGI